MTMRCDQFIENIDDFRRGGPETATHAAMQEHLATCESCRAALDEAEALRALLRQYAEKPALPDGQYFDTLRARVLERVIIERPAPVAPREATPHVPKWRRPTYWLEIAAVFTVGVLAATIYHQSEPDSPEAVKRRMVALKQSGLDQPPAAVTEQTAAPAALPSAPPSATEAAISPQRPGDVSDPAVSSVSMADSVSPAARSAASLSESPAASAFLSEEAVDVREAASAGSIEQAEIFARRSPDPTAAVAQQALPAAPRSRGEADVRRARPASDIVKQALTLRDVSSQAESGPSVPAFAAAPAPDHAGALAREDVLRPERTITLSRATTLSVQADGVEIDSSNFAGSAARPDAVRFYMSAEDARFRGQFLGAVTLFERAIEAAGASPLAVQAHLRIAEIAAGPLNDPVRARMAFEACLQPALGAHVTPETSATIAARLAVLR